MDDGSLLKKIDTYLDLMDKYNKLDKKEQAVKRDAEMKVYEAVLAKRILDRIEKNDTDKLVEKLKAYHDQILRYELTNRIIDLVNPSDDSVIRGLSRLESSLLQTRDEEDDDEEGKEHVMLKNSASKDMEIINLPVFDFL